MEKPNQKPGKVLLVFAGICIVALPFIVLAAMSYEPEETETTAIEPQSLDFDENGKAIFENYDLISKDYLEGTCTERTLTEYYSRMAPVECLTCHARGGWTEELKRHTPRTPHPEQTACRQCHVAMTEAELFAEIDWASVMPPRLGRATLPGAPPPIPHELQMRGNCIACHVGPGTVATIRVEHPSRGNCRQCHVPESNAAPFERKPTS
jgi:cytochrome c-type protein NapB